MKLLSIPGMMLGAGMMALGNLMPPLAGQRHATVLARPVDYDGLGRKKKAPRHPQHNARRRSQAWAAYAAKVVSTHSDRPDPRHDKYLHSDARSRRAR